MMDSGGRLEMEIRRGRLDLFPARSQTHLGLAPLPRPEKVAAGKQALMAMACQLRMERGLRC